MLTHVCVQRQKSQKVGAHTSTHTLLLTHACRAALHCVAFRAPIVRLADFNLCSLAELSWWETALLTSFQTLQQQGVAWGNRGQGASLVEMSTTEPSAHMLEVEVHGAENYCHTDKAVWKTFQ